MNRLVWTDTRAYLSGPVALGLRSDADHTLDLIEAILGISPIAGVDAPPNLSVVMPSVADPTSNNGGRSVTALNVLYQSHAATVRTRDPIRLIRAIAHHLEEPRRRLESSLWVRHTVLVRGEDAVVTPAHLVNRISQLEPPLNKAGIRFGDVPIANVDPRAGTVTIPELELDHERLESLGARRLGRELPFVQSGTYRLRAWAFLTPHDPHPMTPAMATASALRGLVSVPPIRDTALALLERFRTIPAEAIGSLAHADLDERLESLF